MMKFLSSVIFLLAILFLALQSEEICQTESAGNDSIDVKEILNVFIGEWEGSSTAYFPRVKDRPNREETVTAAGTKILNSNYVQCVSNWIQTNGQTRELYIYFNFDENDKKFKILFLYDDWGEIVHYPLTYDAEKRVFRGVDTFTTSKGVHGEEHVEWWISEDGNEITGREFNHYETDPENYWPMSFEFVWRRK